MINLAAGTCVACRGGEPTLAEAEIVELYPQIPEWQVVAQDSILRLQHGRENR